MRIIKLPEVKHLTGLGRSSIYRMVAEGIFPASVSLGGGRSVGWVESEVVGWITERIQERKPRQEQQQPTTQIGGK